MGGHSPQKREYDNLAKACFESRGYEVEFVGGRLADLVAWNRVTWEFAVIEVKSPREGDAAIHFESEKSYVDVKGVSREEVWRLIKALHFATESPGMARLLAFTVTNQLYTYWLRADEHRRRFQTKKRRDIVPIQVTAFLVLPIESWQFASRVLQFLQGLGLVHAFNASDCPRVSTIEIQYPKLSC